jgi:hypothetical protein
MSHPDNLKHQMAAIAREEAKGLKRVLVTVPIEKVPELKRLVKKWRDKDALNQKVTNGGSF